MKKHLLQLRITAEELAEIDQARKETRESRSAFSRRVLFQRNNETIEGRLIAIEKAFTDLKNNDLKTINIGIRLFNSFAVQMAKWKIKYILHITGKYAFTPSEESSLSMEYEIPGRKGKFDYVDHLRYNLTQKAKEYCK